MRPQELKNTIKVGTFLTLLLAVMMLFVIFIGKENSTFSNKLIIKTRTTNAQNLKPGAVVQLKGIKIGLVTEINIVDMKEVEILFEVNKSFQKWIKKDSITNIASAGLVGDKFLEINGGSPDSPIAGSEDILLSTAPFNMDNIVSRGEDMMLKVGSVLSRIDRILAEIEEKGGLAKTIDNLGKTLAKVDNILANVDAKKVERTVNNFESASSSLAGASEKFSGVMKRIENGPGSLHSLLYDDILHNKIVNLLGGAERNKVMKYFIQKSVETSNEK